MVSRSMADTVVTSEDLERQLEKVCAQARGSTEGVFGPNSLMWQINREAAIFLGAGRALLLQLAHPFVAASIAEHPRSLADPIGRFHRTFRIVFTLVFGTLEQAIDAARWLHHLHARIEGILPEAAGPFAEGTPYFANDISALRWVHATLIESALIAHDLTFASLTDYDRERYYAESVIFAGLFGIPQEVLPSDRKSFMAYTRRCLALIF